MFWPRSHISFESLDIVRLCVLMGMPCMDVLAFGFSGVEIRPD